MSESLLDLESWPEGITAARIPANNNVRSEEAFRGPAISATTAAQPVSPAERDIYILPASPTGPQWGGFDEGDVVIYYEATWTAYTPFDGLRKFVEDEGEDWQYVGDSSGGWAAASGGGGGVVVSVVAGTNITVDSTDPANPIVSASGGGSPGGADKQIQYNDSGSFGGEAGFEYDETTNTLTVPNETLSGLLNEVKGTDIASAGTTNIATATGNFVHITGTTTITALGTAQAGAQRILVFDGALTLTHNSTSLILPTGANITTVAGDTAFMVSEGSGNWRCVAYLRKDGSALLGGGGSLTNWTEAVNTSSPNATIPVVSFVATNAATNVDAVLKAKGNGAVSAQVADSTATGGNKRGRNAVDWQSTRTASANVASGDNATIGGGNDNLANNSLATVAGGGTNSASSTSATVGGGSSNTASGSVSVVAGGGSNTASGQNAGVLGGSGNVASGQYSAILGGLNGTADGTHATTLGGNAAKVRGCHGAAARSATTFLVTAGDTQTRHYWPLADTTDATPEAMTTNNAAAATSNTVVLPNSSVFLVRGDVCARQQTTGDVKTWEFRATIKRGANAAATAIVGTAVVTVCDADAGAAAWALAITANTTLGGLAIGITGEAAKNIKWAATVRSLENITA